MTSALRIQIVDYRLGNLFSIRQACQKAGMTPIVSADPDELKNVDGIILPGVGAFGNAMDILRELNLVEALKDAVQSGKPLLGICLGMQLLFEQSEEFGQHAGLGLLSGRICRIPDQVKDQRKLRVPNVGWSRINFADGAAGSAILNEIPDNSYMYFVHSYHAEPSCPAEVLLNTVYGTKCYCSATRKGNILGLQFHPEKSGEIGLKFYRNWARSI